ncbi:hypothetical protein [Spirosoma panaciterrae]|uniref:hypothetical protein n=1 Tax=Spirosoma panaciterrae TaxID=496058 RepID=UPI0012FB2B46|nr:hypothetical protein [Spirosoma panaciterrae]
MVSFLILRVMSGHCPKQARSGHFGLLNDPEKQVVQQTAPEPFLKIPCLVRYWSVDQG